MVRESGRAAAAVMMGVVLLLGLVVEQMDAKSCCKTTLARNCYNTCRLPCKFSGKYCPPRSVCAGTCGCKIITGNKCPPGYLKSMLEASSDATITEYCELGCVSSACEEAMTIITNDDNTGEGSEAVEHCKNACSELCNKAASTSASENIALA